MKKKSGMFKLEPDKFSIHTFEISKKNDKSKLQKNARSTVLPMP